MRAEFWWGNLKERFHIVGIRIHRRTIIKLILEGNFWWMWTKFVWLWIENSGALF
jgi:hypothetical protein